MNKEKLKESIFQAKRFIETAEKALDLHVMNKSSFGGGDYPSSNGRANASCKRASMDLTNSLADLRKPN